MKIPIICEICGHKWMIELKPRETIECPNCKRIFNMIKVMNDPENKDFIKQINLQILKDSGCCGIHS